MFSLKGKTALITGSGRGIGLAIAEAMAQQGADIFLSDINGAVVDRAAADLGARFPKVTVRGLILDVTDKAQIDKAMQTIAEAGKGLQILVNNAGINLREPVADMDDAVWQRMLDTNLTSVFRVSRAAFPMLKERGGKVINLCSLMSEIARPTVSPYASTKGAVRQFTRALATEWAEHGIQVNGIAPGFIATDMNIPLMQDKELNDYIMRHTPAKRWGKPSEVASVATFLASPAADFVNGQVIFIDGGFIDTLRFFHPEPHLYTWWSFRANARANNKGWRIDYAMASEAVRPILRDARILSDVRHSDHCPMLLEIDF